MRGSRLVVLGLFVLAVAGVFWLMRHPSGPTAGPGETSPVVSAERVPAAPSAEAAPSAPPSVALEPPPAPLPKTRSGVTQLPPPSADAEALERDLTHVQFMFREYHDVLGENPVGNNAEIMRAILGDNLKQAKIGAPEGQTVNGEGELCDRWGTPYFFHQVSRDKMEIRSAGPDRKMWTADDRQM